ncbi:MAG TPA: AtpZ/AtpI family protein [Gemmatimonadaceae bacterium]|nr:AtpZ/AtpI family protein [Gemmatimonadaceae bacterium]
MKDEPGGSGGTPRTPPHDPQGRSTLGGRTLSGAAFAGVGIQFALTILVFAYLGNWVDGKLGTSPWLLVLGVLLGGAGGFYSMYRRLMAASGRDPRKR